MTITLTTNIGELVRTVQIPPFNPPPEVVTWGARTFVRRHDLTYMEGLAYPAEVADLFENRLP